MHYVMSDIHGCYKQYIELLEKIGFNDDDLLFVLGDTVDRGPRLMDMSARFNVIPIVGNHEYMMMSVIKKLMVERSEDNYATWLDEEFMREYSLWMENGGDTTIKQFQKLDMEEKQLVIDYLDEFSLYETERVNGKEFIMVHADLCGFSKSRPLEDYRIDEMIFTNTDYNKVYFEDKFLITGHIPNFSIEENCDRVIEKNNHIAIDCGCVYGGSLCVYCLETGESRYAGV